MLLTPIKAPRVANKHRHYVICEPVSITGLKTNGPAVDLGGKLAVDEPSAKSSKKPREYLTTLWPTKQMFVSELSRKMAENIG
jgi:hypothetical protein